ncbi:hypothetical protein ABPG77_006886 [Micractinium sp. CCAP 211/92]
MRGREQARSATAEAQLTAGSGAEAHFADGVTLSRAAAAREVTFDRRLLLFSLLLHVSVQTASLLNWRALPASETAQRALSVVAVLAFYLLPTVAPRLYLRWRTQALLANRLVFFAFPLLRKPRGIQQVLNAAPRPGVRGAMKDLFRIIWGGRLVATLMGAMFNPLPLLPLLPHVAVQAYSVFMVRGNSSLCVAPLLSHPLTAQRIRSLHSAMRLLAAFLPGGLGQVLGPQAGSEAAGPAGPAVPAGSAARDELAQQRTECEAFLNFLYWTVGWLLPMCLILKTEPLHSVRRWEAACGPVTGGSSNWHARPAAAAEALLRYLAGPSWLARRRQRRAWWEVALARCVLLAVVWRLACTAAT